MNDFNLIFDLDGTLIDSAPSILASFEKVVVDSGYKLLVPLHVNLIGPPLKNTLSRITGLHEEEKLLPLIDAFKSHYDDLGLRSTQPFPCMTNMLKQLQARGAKLHVATNKRARPTRSIIELLGWNGLFLSVYTQDRTTPGYVDKSVMLECQLRENKIDVANAIYIGDTREDGVAAAANRLHFIAVDWGYGNFDAWPNVASWSRVAGPKRLMDELNNFGQEQDETVPLSTQS
jgi:phosphoglycolate phosphatase